MLAQHDKFLSFYVLPILDDKLRFCMTAKWDSWVTCMTDSRVTPDKHDKHALFQTQTYLQSIPLKSLSYTLVKKSVAVRKKMHTKM